MSRIAILGCGPAGLAAASAVAGSGHEAVIISANAEPSRLYGCQYLHAPIPGYEDVPHVRVSYSLNGSPEGYRRKVYGDAWQGKVSPEDFVGEHDAWDIRKTYQRMWGDLIESGKVELWERSVSHGVMNSLPLAEPALIVSTIPAQYLCYKEHEFRGVSIWANGSTSQGLTEKNSILCDGTPQKPWYRISNVFGYLTTEWKLPPPRWCNAVPVVKPLSTDCDCHPEIFRAGRYGAWTKSVLVHEVYPAVMEAIRERV